MPTGELSDDASRYAEPIEGYGRVWGCSAAGQIEEPRTYALNMWNEAMTAIINPLGVPSTALPSVEEITDPDANNSTPSVGGSYYLCINPAKFGSIDAVKARSDAYVDAIQNCPPRPNHSVRVPGSVGYQRLIENSAEVDVLTNHWDPFFVGIAGKYGLSEQALRDGFQAERG